MDTQDLQPSPLLVKEFDRSVHTDVYLEWLALHQLDTGLIFDLPRIGFIAEQDGIFYAAGFLRGLEACESMLLDGLMANPKTFGKIRSNAIDRVVEALITQAKKMGIDQILAFSTDKGTIKRSKRHGFVETSQTMIALKLGV